MRASWTNYDSCRRAPTISECGAVITFDEQASAGQSNKSLADRTSRSFWKDLFFKTGNRLFFLTIKQEALVLLWNAIEPFFVLYLNGHEEIPLFATLSEFTALIQISASPYWYPCAITCKGDESVRRKLTEKWL